MGLCRRHTRHKTSVNKKRALDIYIQHASPGADKQSNWLPAPSGAFQLGLRLYWPQESALDSSWVPPPVLAEGPTNTTTNVTTSAS